MTIDLTTLRSEARKKATSAARLQELARLDPALARAVAHRATIPLPLQQELCRHKDAKVRQALAGNRKADPTVHIALARDPALPVVLALVDNPVAPDQALDLLAIRTEPKVKAELLNRMYLPESTVLKLAGRLENNERFSYSHLSDLSVQTQLVLLNLPNCQQDLAHVGEFPEATLLDLAARAPADTRLALASRMDMDQYPALVERLLHDSAGEVRSELARSAGADGELLSTEQFGHLLHDPYPWVAVALAGGAAWPPEKYHDLYRLNRPEVTLALAENWRIPEDLMVLLARHPDEAIRLKLAGCWWSERAWYGDRRGTTFVPAAVLEILRHDPLPEVRATLLFYLSAEDRAGFATDPDPAVQQELIRIKGLF